MSSKASKKRNIRKYNEQRKTDKNKSVYIVISKTQTFPSRVIKMWTREPYAHTSLSLDLELNEMYSFARKFLHNPFYCGFISEDIDKGVFGRDKETMCMVLRLPVNVDEYKHIVKEVDKFKRNRSFYKYNYLGIVGVMVNRSVEREYNYFCSQFVDYVLKKSGIKLFDKKSGLVRPEDFRTCDRLEVVYEGKLALYRNFLRSALENASAIDDKTSEIPNNVIDIHNHNIEIKNKA